MRLRQGVCLAALASTAATQSIKTVLYASWKQTSLLGEASEFLASLSHEHFWAFVDSLSTLPNMETQQDEYTVATNEVRRLAGTTMAELWNVSLALREFSPAVEADSQLARNALHSIVPESEECQQSAAFVVTNGLRVFCNVNDLEIGLKDLTGPAPTLYSHDRLRKPVIGQPSAVAVLYGQLGTELFQNFNKILVNQLDSHDNFAYVVRHYKREKAGDDFLPILSGYGVEIAVKNTEYKAVDNRQVQEDDSERLANMFAETDTTWDVEEENLELEGLRFGTLKSRHPDKADQLDRLHQRLLAPNKLAVVREWELQDLGIQATGRVVRAGQSGALHTLRDICQNLPSLAGHLIKDKVSHELVQEVEANTQTLREIYNVDQVEGMLLVNGVQMPVLNLDPFRISRQLRKDEQVVQQLLDIDVPKAIVNDLIMTPDPAANNNPEEVYLDCRSPGLFWANDLESDEEYQGLPDSIKVLPHRTMYGQPHKLRRNLVHAVFVISPQSRSLSKIIDVARTYRRFAAPVRFGFVFYTSITKKGRPSLDVNENVDNEALANDEVALLRIMEFLSTEVNPRTAFDWLDTVVKSEGQPSLVNMQRMASLYAGEQIKAIGWNNIITGQQYDRLWKGGDLFIQSTGLDPLDDVSLFINGVKCPAEVTTLDYTLFQSIGLFHSEIVNGMRAGEVSDDTTNFFDWFMNMPRIASRINSLVHGPLATVGPISFLAGDLHEAHTPSQLAGYALNALDYYKGPATTDLYPVTHWLAVDLSTWQGVHMAYHSLMRMTESDGDGIAMAIMAHGEEAFARDLARTLLAVQRSQSQPIALEFSTKLLAKVYSATDRLEKIPDPGVVNNWVTEIFTGLGKSFDRTEYDKELGNQSLEEALNFSATVANQVVGLRPGESAVVVNGQILGPLGEGKLLIGQDLKVAEKRSRAWIEDLIGSTLNQRDMDIDSKKMATRDKVFGVLSVLGSQREKRVKVTDKLLNSYSMVHLPAKDDASVFGTLVLVIDPLTKAAQKVVQPVQALHHSLGLEVYLHMVPSTQLSAMPLTRFYRYALSVVPSFNDQHRLIGPMAAFYNLPEEPLLTLSLDNPGEWDLQAVSAVHDLDNIHLQSVKGGVYAAFQLSHLLVEGRCHDGYEPARGLQLQLGTPQEPRQSDTLVMANLGYFQIKAKPGVWLLGLRPGRTTELYTFEDDTMQSTVVVRDFTTELQHIQVKKRPGMEKMSLLDPTEQEKAGGGKEKVDDDSNDDETINVYSLASGHLYERFLSIMMLSVVQHTSHPVKFWLLEAPLSPRFKKFLPYLADEYGFKYQFVGYNWPSWLAAQTEKQRIIWGYKILFLDVLFPMGVKRVIFVDADQIVRTDLWELMSMDLDHAPYAYTPFCSDRPEMAKYRFWERGYWASHLHGRPYHISALYVIDLSQFRLRAAGDVLRMNYHQLSQDPNSLSNLDQDLPNQMSHQLPIFSLPQEWLWCETWCSAASKAKAKTIDLCNNPETKEPKLEAAQRIIPEWRDLDSMVAKVHAKAIGAHVQPIRDEL